MINREKLAFAPRLLCGALLLHPWPVSGGSTNALSEHYQRPGRLGAEAANYEWQDAKRSRAVPVRIYSPQNGAGPFPVIIFSHGLGGSREGYEYLGRHWVSHGYLSVHLQHLGSDDAVWKHASGEDRLQAMRRAAANPQNSWNRPLDVSFALDQITKLNAEPGPLRGRVDMERVGVAGHSFGAYTTLAVAGQVFVGPLVDGKTLKDPRVKAAIPMSSPVPRAHSRFDRAFGSIRVPCLHMTGTKDSSILNDTKPEERRIPYDHIHRADQDLLIFQDGDHMIFSGRGRLGTAAKDGRFQELIRMSSTAFWDAYLKDDTEARRWLAQGDFEHALGAEGTFEKKLLPKR
jgi:predicted dienelactone hydrolase